MAAIKRPRPRSDQIESDHGLVFSLEHDLFGKPASTFPDHALAVEPQQVVPGQTESADGCFTTNAGVRPVPIVAVQPIRQLLGSCTVLLEANPNARCVAAGVAARMRGRFLFDRRHWTSWPYVLLICRFPARLFFILLRGGMLGRIIILALL